MGDTTHPGKNMICPPPIYHCKHNYVISIILIIRNEITCADYRHLMSSHSLMTLVQPWPRHVNGTVTVMPCTWPMRRISCLVTCLMSWNPSLGSKKAAKETVPNLLLALVNMVLEGPSIRDQSEYPATLAALTIAQLLKFNSVKHRQLEGLSANVRHSTAQETPVPMTIGLMVHAQTRKREHVGVSITYDHVLRLSAQLGETFIQQFHKEQVVCHPKMRGYVFPTAAVDNIDHNPSWTTSKESFQGTGISLFQHPAFAGQGVDCSIVIVGGSAGQKTVGHFPSYYTEVPPVFSSTTKAPVPPSTVASLSRENSNHNIKEEYCWLNVRKILALASDDEENSVNQSVDMSWAAYHASHQSAGRKVICPSALRPLFHESAHTVAIIKQSMDVVRKAVQHLNAGQTPVVTFDQPLYVFAKQLQWKWPEMYGEDTFVVMFGGQMWSGDVNMPSR